MNRITVVQVPLSDQWLVQGDLFYKLEGVDKGDEDVNDKVVIDLTRIVDGPTDLEGTTGGHAVPLLVRANLEVKLF